MLPSPDTGVLPDAASRLAPYNWPRFFSTAGFTVLVSAFVAAILTLSSRGEDSFWRNLLYSQCIGLSIFGWALLLSHPHWLWKRRKRRARTAATVVAVTAVAAPLGYITGYMLTLLLLGQTVELGALLGSRSIAILATGLASVFAVYFFWLRDRLAHEAAARSEAQRLAVESQLRLLRAQLEPHMLFNTLANLRSLVEIDVPESQRMIDQLTTYLRGSLAASRSDTTTLQQEFTQLRAYLEIMSLRMGTRLSYAVELPEALAQTAIPPMLLQPLVENAIKHGIEPKVGPGRIEVAAERQQGDIEITVTDTGLGLPPGGVPEAAAGESGSYGIFHVRERLRAVYGRRASLTFSTHPPQGVRATVRFPA